MKKIFTAFLLVILFSSSIFSQTNHDKMLAKLASLNGNWTGYLEYLDYSDGKSKVKLPTELNAVYNKSGSDNFLFVQFIYDEGKGRSVTGEDAWTIFDEETIFYDSIGCRIINFSINDGKTVIEFERPGEDNNKPCIINHIFTIEKDSFSNSKRVKIEGEKDYFIRHEYFFKRKN